MRKPETRRTLLQALKDLLRRFRRKAGPPGDPYADRSAPVRSGPRGRSGAAAVAEPEEESFRSFPPRR